MYPAEKDIAFTAVREECVLTCYPDTHNPAIGFGINDPTLKPGDTIDLDEACRRLVSVMQANGVALAKIFPDHVLLQQHVGALLSLGFNIGMGALRRNVALVNAMDEFFFDPKNAALRDLAAKQIILANMDETTGRPFNLSRRCREALLFISGDYGDLSTLMLWPAGKSPKNTPPDPPIFVPMPTFLKG